MLLPPPFATYANLAFGSTTTESGLLYAGNGEPAMGVKAPLEATLYAETLSLPSSAN
jgi:hypothetical protein